MRINGQNLDVRTTFKPVSVSDEITGQCMLIELVSDKNGSNMSFSCFHFYLSAITTTKLIRTQHCSSCLFISTMPVFPHEEIVDFQ